MTLKKDDIDDLRTSDTSASSLTFSSNAKKYPHNKETSSSSSVVTAAKSNYHPVILRSSSTERGNQHDPNVDKFATLFAPSTPRASPTLLPPVPQSFSSTFRSQIQKERSTTDYSRSFMTISADEDPLSLSTASSESSLGAPMTFEWDKDDNELLTTPVLLPVPASQQPSNQPTRKDNTSLAFFDKFAQDAKRNSEIRRKGLMDELLKCEDNPLYFLPNKSESTQKGDEEDHEDRPRTLVDNDNESTSPELPQTSPPSSLLPVDTVLHDLDHEFFLSSHPVNDNTHNDNEITPSEQRHPGSSHSRSPSLPSPATLAPPIIDSKISSDPHNLSTGSFSKASSSTFSARWMSNLLKTNSGTGHHHHQQGHGGTPNLESIFTDATSLSSSISSSHPTSGTSSQALTAPEIYRRNSSTPPMRHSTLHPQQHLSHTLPMPSTSSSLGGIIKHKASPFATHAYIPPSGAPGFRGDLYDWDKGFSNELEKEIIRGRTNGRGDKKGDVEVKGMTLETEMQPHIRADVGICIGAFMEKKSGDLNLKGRRASTTPVLSPNLAILIRPHLPALSRLPRSWTLVYSLDQHGISLNTLYTRCEETLSPSRALYPSRVEGVGLGTRGVLLVIKDASAASEADEGVFGAWIADGEGLGMGRKGGKGYFGGGESFLWRFTQGTLKVYKTTGRNNYVALCEPNYISFGGGDGHYGLYLDDTLYDGSSAPCPTFDNEPLCSPGPKKAGTATVEFECVGLEVWGMGP